MAKWLNDDSVAITHACAACGSAGGLLPSTPASVQLRLRYIQPNWNGTGKAAPFTTTLCVAAGKGIRLSPGGHWEGVTEDGVEPANGQKNGTVACSCSSKVVRPSWP